MNTYFQICERPRRWIRASQTDCATKAVGVDGRFDVLQRGDTAAVAAAAGDANAGPPRRLLAETAREGAR